MATTKREEVITMPMLRVKCIPRLGKADGWPEYVQTLPEVGDMMERRPDHKRAWVESRCFCPDGTIEIELRDDCPD